MVLQEMRNRGIDSKKSTADIEWSGFETVPDFGFAKYIVYKINGGRQILYSAKLPSKFTKPYSRTCFQLSQ